MFLCDNERKSCDVEVSGVLGALRKTGMLLPLVALGEGNPKPWEGGGVASPRGLSTVHPPQVVGLCFAFRDFAALSK